MPARTGAEFRDALNGSRRDVQVHGERGASGSGSTLRCAVSWRATRACSTCSTSRTCATCSRTSPRPRAIASRCRFEPKTQEDLVRRRAMMKAWADWSLGTLGRTGDYLNSALMAMAAAADWFGQKDAAYAENVRRYCEHVRENDLLLTHTLINPQSNRSVSAASQADPFLAARIVEETGEGIVIRGARMLATLGPIADEIMVFPSTVLQGHTRGRAVRERLRDPVRHTGPALPLPRASTTAAVTSTTRSPRASRRSTRSSSSTTCSCRGSAASWCAARSCSTAAACTTRRTAIVHMTHQVVTRTIAKTEALLGLVDRMVDAIQIGQFQHVQEKTADVIMTLEILRAHPRVGSGRATRFGVMTPAWAPLNAARNWFPRTYPRLRDVIRQVGAAESSAFRPRATCSARPARTSSAFLQVASLGGPSVLFGSPGTGRYRPSQAARRRTSSLLRRPGANGRGPRGLVRPRSLCRAHRGVPPPRRGGSGPATASTASA